MQNLARLDDKPEALHPASYKAPPVTTAWFQTIGLRGLGSSIADSWRGAVRAAQATIQSGQDVLRTNIGHDFGHLGKQRTRNEVAAALSCRVTELNTGNTGHPYMPFTCASGAPTKLNAAANQKISVVKKSWPACRSCVFSRCPTCQCPAWQSLFYLQSRCHRAAVRGYHKPPPHRQAGSKAQNRFVQAKITSLPNITSFFQTQFSETVFQSVQMKVNCPVA